MSFSFKSAGFPARLKALIEAQGWDQIPFAERVLDVSGKNIGQGRISTLSRGKSDPSLEDVEALAAALGVAPSWLAFGEGKVEQRLHPSPKTKPLGERMNGKSGRRTR